MDFLARLLTISKTSVEGTLIASLSSLAMEDFPDPEQPEMPMMRGVADDIWAYSIVE